MNDVVIVAAAGTLAGYDIATGALRWKGPSYGGSYSSPHCATIDGVLQVVLLGGPGARTWKGGRYGNGQMILQAERDLLLVLSEERSCTAGSS